MDSGIETETQNEANQPDEVVVTESEENKAKPQADITDKQEFYVDEDSGDQEEKPKHGMTQEQAYAAFQKEKRKRKDKQAEIDKQKDEAEKLKREIAELKAAVGSITRGKPPTLESCDYDEDVFNQKMKEYYSSPSVDSPAKQEEPKATQNNSRAAEEAEFYLYQREQELKQSVPDYDETKNNVIESMRNVGIPEEGIEQAIIYLSDVAKKSNVDIAKSFMAMGKMPSLVQELNAANNPFAVAEVLKKAESKVKIRAHQNIDMLPEPNIESTGPIDSSNAAVEKLRQVWVKNPNAKNFQAYNQAKQKLKKVN